MNKILTAFLFLLSISHVAFAQFGSNVPADNQCLIGADAAQRDIENGKARLLLVGGIAPKIYGNEDAFEQKYGVSYHDYGCMPPSPLACLSAYNREVFIHLEKVYGHQWKEEIRDDVIGLQSYLTPFSKIFGG